METKPTCVRLTQVQEKKIAKINVSKSEFIRRAVDHYIMFLENPYNAELLNDLELWIQSKRNQGVLHINTDVSETNTNVSETNTDVSETNTNVSETNTNDTQAIHHTNNPTLETLLQPQLPIIQRLLNNPANMNSLPEHTLKMLSKEHAISKTSIEAWVAENVEFLKHENFEDEQHD